MGSVTSVMVELARKATFVDLMLAITIGPSYHLVRCLVKKPDKNHVWIGRDEITGNEVLLKMNPNNIDRRDSQVANEGYVYKDLKDAVGFPTLFWYGNTDYMRVLVMEFLGPSLKDLLVFCGGKFSLKTTLMLADQIIERLETFNARGWTHRDLKPENFLLGTGENGNVVYLADFGLANSTESRGWDDKFRARGERIDLDSRGRTMIGTPNFASIHGHYFIDQHARDDLEALGYMLIYFVRGTLPWCDLQSAPEEDFCDLIADKKRSLSVEELCYGLPPAFATFMHYVDTLVGRDMPDYRYARKIFMDLAEERRFVYDNVFDWTIIQYCRLNGLRISDLLSSECKAALKSQGVDIESDEITMLEPKVVEKLDRLEEALYLNSLEVEEVDEREGIEVLRDLVEDMDASPCKDLFQRFTFDDGMTGERALPKHTALSFLLDI